MSGYIVICIRDHPLFPGQKFVGQHRLVMAESLGRSLLTEEDVHHKDENRLNNQIDNLEIKLHGPHSAFHMRGKIFSAETRKKMSLVNMGKHLSIETRHRMSLAKKGKSNHRLGKHHTVEAKRKMSLARIYHHLQLRFPGI